MRTDVLKTGTVETDVIKAVTIETTEPAEIPNIPPTTTREEDKHSESQREVNKIWEYTQAAIALAVTIGTLGTAAYGVSSDTMSNAFFLVVGFYFGRTNHQRVGGVQIGR